MEYSKSERIPKGSEWKICYYKYIIYNNQVLSNINTTILYISNTNIFTINNYINTNSIIKYI